MKLTRWVLATETGDLLYRGNANSQFGYPDFHLGWLLMNAIEGQAVCVTGRRKCEVLPTAKLWNGYHSKHKKKTTVKWRVKPLKMTVDFALFDGKRRVFNPDEIRRCVKCIRQDGNPKCPHFGEPDGCNDREAMEAAHKWMERNGVKRRAAR